MRGMRLVVGFAIVGMRGELPSGNFISHRISQTLKNYRGPIGRHAPISNRQRHRSGSAITDQDFLFPHTVAIACAVLHATSRHKCLHAS